MAQARKHIRSSLNLCTALVCLVSTPVWAQDRPDDSSVRQVFEAAYFTEFAPQSALDMILRVPGFTLDISNNVERGLGQRTDNVLIDGRQLSSKNSNIRDELERLTVSKIVQIEIIDGTTLGIPGLTGDVANVITRSGGLTGTWEWRPQFRENRQPLLNEARLSIAGDAENLTYSLSFEEDGNRRGGVGLETRTDANGVLFEERLDDVQIFLSNPSLTGTTTWTPRPDHVLTLNGFFTTQNFNDRTQTDRLAIADPGETGFLFFTAGQDDIGGEFSFDYEQPLARGKIKLIGLTNLFDTEVGTQLDDFDEFGNLSGSRFERDVLQREIIGRVEYRFGGEAKNDWDLAFETAFNRLTNDSQLLVRLQDNADFTLDESTLSSIRVEEIRSIATITRNWTLGKKWNFQASASGEYSEISSVDINDFSLSQDFVRPRGRFNATYAYDEDLDIRLSLERRVGQLDFFAFTNTIGLDSGVSRDANVNLVPDQTSEVELEFDKTLWDQSNLRLTLTGARIDDVIDSIPIGEDGDGTGNLDDPAYVYSAELSGTLKGADFGIPGLEFGFSGLVTGSNIDDPLTGINRRINDQTRYELEADIRYDFPNSNWAIGSDADFSRDSIDFRVTTTQLDFPDRPDWDLFIEHQNIFGVKVRVDINNLLGERAVTERVFFLGRRDLEPIDFIERRELEIGRSVRINFSGSF